MTRTEKLKEVSQAAPCTVCEGQRGCSRGSNGLILCVRRKGKEPGFVYLGQAEKRPEFALYRCHDDPRLTVDKEHASHSNGKPATSNGHAGGGCTAEQAKKTPEQWEAIHKQFRQNAYTADIDQLSKELGLPVPGIRERLEVGFHLDLENQSWWTFPERDSEHRIVGIMRRTGTGWKRVMPGSGRGLYIPYGFANASKTIYIPEGASDVWSWCLMGRSVVGRSSSMSGADMIAGLLGSHYDDKDLCVVGENDCKADGRWPGKEGAQTVAKKLSELTKRAVSWCLPPDGAKDTREWLTKQMAKHPEVADLSKFGDQWEERVRDKGLLWTESETVAETVQTKSLACLNYQVTEWLVPDIIPLGKPIMLAGNGGHGKSLITCHMAAQLSRGRPLFGLHETAIGPCDTVLISCEDDPSRTILPRAAAMDADMSRVHICEGVGPYKGKARRFVLSDFLALEKMLQGNPRIKLVVIDPAGSYVDPKYNENADNELRSLLNPLLELAEKHQITILFVKHLNKGVGLAAAHRVSGAVTWSNTCRLNFMVGPDKDDDDGRLLIPFKWNDMKKPLGFRYRVECVPWEEVTQILEKQRCAIPREKWPELAKQFARVEWCGSTDESADEAFKEDSDSGMRRKNELKEAADWLKDRLSCGPVPASTIIEEGNKAMGLSRDAKWWRTTVLVPLLGGQSRKSSQFHGPWYFCLPGQMPRETDSGCSENGHLVEQVAPLITDLPDDRGPYRR